ncbi:MAG: GTP-binding protein [Nanoarchaeota archaeon]
MKVKAWKKLTELKYVGEKSARRLYEKGFLTKEDVLNAKAKKLAKIVGPVGYRILKENKPGKEVEEIKEKPEIHVPPRKGIKERILSGLESFRALLRLRRTFVMGIYGPPNTGKTTLANKISMDFLGEEVGTVSDIPHETREIAVKKGVKIETKDGSIKIDLADTPGYITKINQKEFLRHGLTKKEVSERTIKASQGVIESIRFMDKINMSLVVLDSAKSLEKQENILLFESLKAKNIPFLVVANKIDLKKANPERIIKRFQDCNVAAISAKKGHNIDQLYREIVRIASGSK